MVDGKTEKGNTEFEIDTRVSADVDIKPGTVISPRVVTVGLFKTPQKKQTFTEVIAPLGHLLTNINNFIKGRAAEVRKNKYTVEQLRLEIEVDIAEIEDAEGSAQFIEQVIVACKKPKQ